jgi:hydrogenase maturation protease
MAVTSGHAFGLAEAVQLARTLGLAPAEIVVYAVEGGCFEGGAEMTAAVTGAVAEVARLVIEEVRLLRQSVTEMNAHA